MNAVKNKGASKSSTPKASANKAATKRATAAARAGAKDSAAKRSGVKEGAAARAADARKKRAGARSSAQRGAAQPAKAHGRRADLGGEIEPFFAKQPPALRAILLALRALIDEAAPDATASLKWGMPFYTRGKGMASMICALGAHKAHVNLILPGPPGTYADPDGLLIGDAKSGKHLKLQTLAELPSEAVRGFLRTASERATAG